MDARPGGPHDDVGRILPQVDLTAILALTALLADTRGDNSAERSSSSALRVPKADWMVDQHRMVTLEPTAKKGRLCWRIHSVAGVIIGVDWDPAELLFCVAKARHWA
jgi:hypothetical protein